MVFIKWKNLNCTENFHIFKKCIYQLLTHVYQYFNLYNDIQSSIELCYGSITYIGIEPLRYNIFLCLWNIKILPL